MTAAPKEDANSNNNDDDDGDLGLNLVFSVPTPSASSSTAGGASSFSLNATSTTITNTKKPKRKTKYDRRRERGRLATLAKEEEKRGKKQGMEVVGTNKLPAAADCKMISSSLAGVASALSVGSTIKDKSPSLADAGAGAGAGGAAPSTTISATAIAKNTSLATTTTDDNDSDAKTNNNKGAGGGNNNNVDAALDTTTTTPATTNSKKTSSSSKDGANKITTGDKIIEDDARSEQQPTSNNNNEPVPDNKSSSSSLPSTNAMHQPVPSSSSSMEDTMASSSRRHRAQTSLTDEQRTAYLSEFHARPRDLDRSERASKSIKVSCASDHIFGTARDDDDGDDDNDDEEEVVENHVNGEKNGSATDVKEMTGKTKKETKAHGAEATATATATTTCPFQKLGLHSNLVSSLTSPNGHFKLSQPTIVQSRSIEALLVPPKKNKNKKKHTTKKLEQNLFIQSETGSGKTLAYLLPILQHLAIDPQTSNLKRIDRQLGGTRAILLCPTRELATQTYTTCNNLCQSSYSWIVPGCFSGGEKRKSEKARLRKGISILIATPGRLLDHLSKTSSLLIALKNKLEWLVLDEADRLLDAGLGGQVEQIVQYLRTNQPGAGSKRDGVSWRSVLVSATVTGELEGLAKTVLGGDGGWMWARGHNHRSRSDGIVAAKKGDGSSSNHDDGSRGAHQLDDDQGQQQKNDNQASTMNELDNAAPRQLAQLYMVVSAKLRLSSLIAFLTARAAKGERTVVFLSTCDGVDYHHALLTSMESILGGDDNDDEDADDSEKKKDGIFGKACPIYKLHGDIPHNKRVSILKAFNNSSSAKNDPQEQQQQHSAILLATDVAARGLNFPSLDWIVQYDPPCETKDYVHRAGRSARAGAAGHALLFLLPSERQYVEVLQLRGLKEISPLSLSSTLTCAAELSHGGLLQEGEAKAAGNTFSDGRGEAFTTAIQNRLEQCVLQDDVNYKAAIEKKTKGNDPKQRRRQKRGAVGPLLEGARKAFSAFVRAYPAKEKAVRHMFNARALHLGHIARSLALKETPKMVSKGNNKSNDAKKKSTRGDNSQAASGGGGGKGEKRKSRLAFGDNPTSEEKNDDDDVMATIEDEEQDRNLSLLGDAIGGQTGSRRFPANKKMKSSSSTKGGGSGRDNVQKRMMEAAMMMQAQEFM